MSNTNLLRQFRCSKASTPKYCQFPAGKLPRAFCEVVEDDSPVYVLIVTRKNNSCAKKFKTGKKQHLGIVQAVYSKKLYKF